MPVGQIIDAMGNGLKSARERRGMTQEEAASALGLSKGGYIKKEQGSRKLGDDLIRRACEVFGVKPEDLLTDITGGSGRRSLPQGEIDPEKLSSFVARARDTLSALSEIEAKNLVLALISAARRP